MPSLPRRPLANVCPTSPKPMNASSVMGSPRLACDRARAVPELGPPPPATSSPLRRRRPAAAAGATRPAAKLRGVDGEPDLAYCLARPLRGGSGCVGETGDGVRFGDRAQVGADCRLCDCSDHRWRPWTSRYSQHCDPEPCQGLRRARPRHPERAAQRGQRQPARLGGADPADLLTHSLLSRCQEGASRRIAWPSPWAASARRATAAAASW